MKGKGVRLTIVSRFDDGMIRREVRGELWESGKHTFVRYPEEEMGNTVTTLKMASGDEGGIRMMRHGEVESGQSFVPGKKERGFYRTAHGSFSLAAFTKSASFRWNGKEGCADWHYDLFVGDDYAGSMAIHIDIREEEQE